MRWLRIGLLVAVLTVAVIFLAPRTNEALDALRHVGGAEPLWLVVALAGEVCSLIAFTMVTWTLIAPPDRPRWRRVFRLDLATVALSHAVPIGSAAGSVLGYELLEEEGIGGVQAGFVKVSQSLLSGVLLQVLLGVTLLVDLLRSGPSDGNLGLAAAGAGLVLLVLGFCFVLALHPHLISVAAVRLLGWVPRVNAPRVGSLVESFSQRMRGLLHRPLVLLRISAWSLLNWLFDLLSLWAAIRAFGSPPSLVLTSVAFCIAQVAATLPISPGGLGVVESSLVPLLTNFGAGSTAAVLGVLSWRLVNYWLPLPAGGIAYLLILLSRHRRRRDPQVSLEAV